MSILEKLRIEIAEEVLKDKLGDRTHPLYHWLMEKAKSKITQQLERVRQIEATFDSLKGKRVFDLGCGFGELAIIMQLKGAEVAGLTRSRRSTDNHGKSATIQCFEPAL